MQSILLQFNRFFERAPQILLPWRWVVLALFLATTGGMLYGMLNHFEMDMSLESWFQDDDPAKLSLDRFRSQFGSDDGVYLVYAAKDGDVFSERSLQTLRDFHNELDNARVGIIDDKEHPNGKLLTRIKRIDSLFNARYLLAEGDTLISNKLIGSDFPAGEAEREARRAIALTQDSFELAYYSRDFLYGGMRIKTDFGTVPEGDGAPAPLAEEDLLLEDDFSLDAPLEVESDAEVATVEYADMQMGEYLDFMRALRRITEKPEYSDHFDFYFTGNAPMMEFAMESMEQASWLLAVMVVVVVGLLWVLFHSFSAVIWPLLVIAGSGFWTIGLASWLGVTLSNMVTLTFMLILAVGIADCVHVLSSYILYRRERHDHRRAMALAYRKTGLPILLTTITTMAGMFALTISDIPQIGVFGVTSALGVLMALLLTVFVLPVLLDIWHPYNEKRLAKLAREEQRHWLQALLDPIPEWVAKAPRTIIAVYMLLFCSLIYGAMQIKVDSNFAELTREGSTIRVTYEIVDENMMGGQNMELMFDFGQTDALKNPQVLRTLEELQRRIEERYPQYVVKSFSLADYVEETNQTMHQGDAGYKRIPDDPRLAAQLLYLFDNANPEDRRELVSDDYSRSHISLQLRNAGSYEYTQFFQSVQEDIERAFTPLQTRFPQMELNATGSLALMMELIEHISWTQIKSFSFALLIITALLMLTLGTIQAGLISMVPNLLPAFFSFGMMGLLGIPLDTDTLIIAPLIIGIAVDDTIHFVAHYRDAWFEQGDVDKALHSTIHEVGQAVTFTSLILGVGFSVLAFSDYLGLAKTGIFGSLAIFVALSSDLLLLPALIKWLKPDLGRRRYLARREV